MNEAFSEKSAKAISASTADDLDDVSGRLDRMPVTWAHLTILVVCALGFTFDLIEIALGSVLSAVFSLPPFGVEPDRLSWLLASVYVGAVIGAPLFGWLADRHGRRVVLMGCLGLLAATSFIGAASPDVATLTVIRAVSGLALGAYPPLMIAYLTDLLPPRQRGMLILSAVTIASLGPVAIVFLVRSLTELSPLGVDAWRWAFVVGGIGSGLASWLFRRLPESPRWLKARGHDSAATAALAQLEGSGPVLVRVGRQPRPHDADAPEPVGGKNGYALLAAFLIALAFLSPWATVGFTLLSGPVLVAKGFGIADTLLYVGVSTFGPVLGAILTALVIDRIRRRAALVFCAALLAVLGLLFAITNAPIALMITGVAFVLVASVYTPVLVIYAAESFPTHLRARATASAWAGNRAGSALVPILLLPLLANRGALAMFSVIAAAMLASIVLLVLFAPKDRAGLAVE